MAYFEATNISKSYGRGDAATHVLESLTLRIEPGEFVSVVGFSGAGKTTLVSILAGLLRPDQGSVVLDGRPVTGPSPERAVVFQTYALLPWLTAFENVYLGVDQVFADWKASRKRSHTERYLAMVGLSAASAKRPAQLSGGMRQRVALARALAIEPAILLLDEPLSALDALTRATLQSELARIHQHSRATMVLVTNDVDEAVLLADRIVPLSAGPRATLGPSFQVDIERPRDRRSINHDAEFKKVRKQVIEFLLASSAERRSQLPPQTTLELSPVPA